MLKFKLADPFKVNTPDPIEVGGRIDEEDGSFMLTFNGEPVISIDCDGSIWDSAEVETIKKFGLEHDDYNLIMNLS